MTGSGRFSARHTPPLALFFALAGCAAAWGSAYHVDFASSTSITIAYDPALARIGEIQNVAQEQCAKYGKDAVIQTNTATRPMAVHSASFLCVDRKE